MGVGAGRRFAAPNRPLRSMSYFLIAHARIVRVVHKSRFWPIPCARARAVAGVLGSMTVLRAAREAKLDSITFFARCARGKVSIKISRAAREVKLDRIKSFASCPRGKFR